MGLISWWHILLVLIVFILLFGAGRVSSLMGDIAKGFKSFNKAMAEEDADKRSGAEFVENKAAKRQRGGIASRSKSSQNLG